MNIRERKMTRKTFESYGWSLVTITTRIMRIMQAAVTACLLCLLCARACVDIRYGGNGSASYVHSQIDMLYIIILCVRYGDASQRTLIFIAICLSSAAVV
jgi:hypothetical protein